MKDYWHTLLTQQYIFPTSTENDYVHLKTLLENLVMISDELKYLSQH